MLLFVVLQDNFVSMGVISDGSYGIKEGLMYSYPVRIANRQWSIVQGLTINDFAREKMDLTAKELEEELQAALAECEWLTDDIPIAVVTPRL